MECSNCGVSERITRLFDVISGEGIVKLCEECLSVDSVPLKRPTGLDPGVERKQSTYERLSGMAGLNPEKHKQSMFNPEKHKEIKQQEVTLRDLVDKKFDSFVKEKEKEERDDVIHNFHWVIMRARRAKKMSVSQIAREIQEPERVIKLAEQGILPDGYDLLLKLEAVLGISIIKPEVAEMLQRQPKRLTFDRVKAKTITISDLQEMKDELDVSESADFSAPKKVPYWKKFVSKLISKREKKEDEPVFREVGGDDIDKELDQSTDSEEMKEEIADFDEDTKENVQYDETSLQMTTSFPGKKEVVEEVKKEEVKEESKEELSQEEIDDLIFGRKG